MSSTSSAPGPVFHIYSLAICDPTKASFLRLDSTKLVARTDATDFTVQNRFLLHEGKRVQLYQNHVRYTPAGAGAGAGAGSLQIETTEMLTGLPGLVLVDKAAQKALDIYDSDSVQLQSYSRNRGIRQTFALLPSVQGESTAAGQRGSQGAALVALSKQPNEQPLGAWCGRLRARTHLEIALEILETCKQGGQGVKAKGGKKDPLTQDNKPAASDQIVVSAYNCLYSVGTDKLCVWETEMVDAGAYNKGKAGRARFGQHAVKKENLCWSKRVTRIAANLKKHAVPDILLLQEVSPGMLASLRASLGVEYTGVQSAYGCCGDGNGHAHVLWKPSAFTKGEVVCGNRYCLVQLTHNATNVSYMFVSVHLRQPGQGGEAAVHELKQLVQLHRKSNGRVRRVILGGDFNVNNNVFAPMLQNISGNENTFYNDEVDKFDWIVASGDVVAGKAMVNAIRQEEGRWPNEVEGSDHTCVTVFIDVTEDLPKTLHSFSTAAPAAPAAAAAAALGGSGPHDYIRPAHALSRAYFDSSKPPTWSLQMVGTSQWVDLAKHVQVFTFDIRRELVRRVATEREPVNISMGREQFLEKKFESAFGWRISGYRSIFELDNRELPPNIAVYMRTPVESAQGPVVHVINATGFAFDSHEQVDHKYFIRDCRETELLVHLKRVFLLVFACAHCKSLPTVVLCLLGGKAFSQKFPGGPERYVSEYFMPALGAAIKRLPTKMRPAQLGMMGDPPSELMVKLRHASGGIPCTGYGYVPDICKAPEAAESLFMNAWDPHSVVGNGNGDDDSLDGYFGRVSAMGYLSFPGINPHISYTFLEHKTLASAGGGPSSSGSSTQPFGTNTPVKKPQPKKSPTPVKKPKSKLPTTPKSLSTNAVLKSGVASSGMPGQGETGGLSALTYNIGYNIALNRDAGSERHAQQKCARIQHADNRNGARIQHADNRTDTLSFCTYEAMVRVAASNYLFIGFQEVHSALMPRMLEVLRQHNPWYNSCTVSQDESGQYDVPILFHASLGTLRCEHGAKQDTRGFNRKNDARRMRCVILQSADSTATVAILNVHVPQTHKVSLDVKTYLTLVGRNLGTLLDATMKRCHITEIPARIWVTGDFNDDHEYVYHNQGLDIILPNNSSKKVFLAPHSADIRSCCYDANYLYLGDYIMDSAVSSGQYLEMAEWSEQNTNTHYSDHHPVMMHGIKK